MVIKETKVKIAQYGQWDGYPSGQGETARLFLSNCDMDKFKEKVNNLRWLNKDEIEAINKESDWSRKYPWLSRDAGAQILEYVYSGQAQKLINSESFAADSLFCEWAYVVDFDENVFEVYEGFNKDPLTKGDRFYYLQKSGEDYYPIKKVKEYNLEFLPAHNIFMKDFESYE